MSTDPTDPRKPLQPDRRAGRLDEDAEALEDPVHSGDALHQREGHTSPDREQQED